MSRIFGPAFQTSYVVERIEPLVKHFTEVLGIGPFFLLPLPFQFDWLEYRGRRTDRHDIFRKAAFAYSGDMMIEIIEPGDAPSHYHEFLERVGRGVHHLGTLATDYTRQVAAARAAGLEVVLEGCAPGVRFAYVETDRDFPATMIEIMELGPNLTDMFGLVKAASIDWDGADPLRQF